MRGGVSSCVELRHHAVMISQHVMCWTVRGGTPVSDELTYEDLQAVAEAAEPPTSEWALRGGMTRTERAMWTYKVGTFTVNTGKSQREVASHFGMSQPTVSRLLQDFWKHWTLPRADEARKHELNIVDKVIDAWLPTAVSGDKDAAAVVAKFMDRRAKLTGSDAPIKVDAQVTEVTQQDLELQELVREAAAANAVKEKEISER